MKSNVYKSVAKFFSDAGLIGPLETLTDLAIKLGYPADTVAIIELEIEQPSVLRTLFPETYENVLSCRHHSDRREPMEYAQDLACSWLFEDTIKMMFRMKGVEIKLDGFDKGRRILPSTKVSSTSDFKIIIGGQELHVELVSDYKGYWGKNGVCDLRDDKWKKVQRLSEDAPSYILGIDIYDGKYFIVNGADKQIKTTYKEHHMPYGGKPATSIDLNGLLKDIYGMDSIVRDFQYAA